jgi:predicted transcriptional regulator of viral defense system
MADRYRRTPVHPAVLANALYAPSYLSGVWALGFFGLIPEKVVAYTSVTTRVPRRFENAFGAFEYRHLKLSFFFGYKAAVIQDENVFLAEPEKALLDFWHLNAGEWDPARMSEMRFQNHDAVNRKRLSDYARRSASPRLSRAVAAWLERADAQREGTVEL